LKITYYLEVLSSWCHWAEPAWAELKARYGARVAFEWRIALMNPSDYPVSRAQCEWFYRRSGGTAMQSPYMLNAGWFEAERKGDYRAPNFVAEAARGLGAADDTVRLALAHAALREGKKMGDMEMAVAVAAEAGGLSPRKLKAAAQSAEVARRVGISTADFHSHRINQRPAFILEDEIGDKVIFSGLVRAQPLAAAIDAMLADSAAYAAHQAHHGPVPPA
jgi:predicted DsbA family dithiol-disulfide isomerase